MAVVLQVPAIFVIENNYYSRAHQHPLRRGCDDLKARTEAFGFPVFVADGADFFAVYEAAGKIAHARAGKGAGRRVRRAGSLPRPLRGDPSITAARASWRTCGRTTTA